MESEDDSNRKFHSDDGTPMRSIHTDATAHCLDILADWFIRKDPRQAKPATAKKQPVRRFISFSFARGFVRWAKRENSGS